MRSWVLALLLVGIIATNLVSGVIYRDEEFNAIVIDDDPDEVIGLEPSEDSPTTQIPTTENQNISTCTSSRGERGTCVKFEKCFPYMTNPDAKTFNYFHLTEILKELAPPCHGGSGLVCCPDLSYDGLPTRKPQFEGQTTQSSVTTTTAAATSSSPPTNGTDNRKSNCGKHDYSPAKVVGGRPATVGEFPFAVALLNNGKQFCGGSLISSQWVLTAAHCIAGLKSFTKVSVNIGDHDVSKPNEVKHQSKGVKRGFYHRMFSMRHLQHDVALLQLSDPVTLSNTANIVCLSNTEPPFGGNGILAGWGKTGKHGAPSPVLRTVTMRVLPHDECKKIYEKEPQAPPVTTNMVCAGEKPQGTTPLKDACNGDSGGPLVRIDGEKATQFGIVSWGIGCGEKPGVYTRVDKYLDWIEKNSKRA